MIQIKLKDLKNPDRWVVENSDDSFIAVRGYLYYKGKLYKGKGLVNLLQKISFEEILSFVEEANGFFAIVKKYNSKLVAIVDRVRSIPIFYGINDKEFFMSDDPYWIREKLGNNTAIDERAKREFLAVGYVTGPDTLYDKIKQLQAGELLFFNDENIEVKPVRYYRYLKKILEKRCV